MQEVLALAPDALVQTGDLGLRLRPVLGALPLPCEFALQARELPLQIGPGVQRFDEISLGCRSEDHDAAVDADRRAGLQLGPRDLRLGLDGNVPAVGFASDSGVLDRA